MQRLSPILLSQQFCLCKMCGKKTFTQIYRNLYGDAMLVPIQMGTNMAARNQQKHLSLGFATKAQIISRGVQNHKNNTFSNTRTFQIAI